MADPQNPPGPFAQTFEPRRSNQFDSIFDRVALPQKDGDSDPDPDENLEGEEPLPQREGLPPGFRMRHDSHYVEELVARNAARRAASTLPDTGAPVAARRPHGERSMMTMSKACAELGVSLDAIGACLRLFPPTPRAASERAALDLIASEVARATWHLQALSILDEELPVANTPVDVGSVARHVKDGLVPAWSRGALVLELPANVRDLRVRGDESLLTVAVAGMVMALQATTDRVGAAVVQLRVREEDGAAIVEARQDAVRIPAAWRTRFFDPEWPDRPGGRRLAVALAASRRIAELHRGVLTLEDIEDGGCDLKLSLPRI